MTEPVETASFRLGYVPGVTPGKWVRIWAERRPHVPLELITATTDEAVELIRTGAVDAAVVRLPIDRTFPLDKAAEALAHMRANAHFGKIALVV